MADHKPLKILLIVLTWLVFLAMLFFNAMQGIASMYLKEWKLFVSSNTNISEKYYLEITPAGWTFSLWGFIYAWQALWLIYATCALCRRSVEGPLYVSPDIFPSSLFVIYMFNNANNIAWLFLFDREYIQYSLIVIALTPFTLYIMMLISCKQLDKYGSVMIQQGMGKDIWMVRVFLHNGLGIYAAWTTIATLLNFAMVLTYYAGMSQDTACTISLGVLAMELIIYFVTDNFLFDKYLRYTIVPYIVVIVALIGSIAKNWDVTKRNSIFTAALLGTAGLCFLVKLVLVIWRSRTRPTFEGKNRPMTM
ncbi:unnamed protein product [Owenia fusiformis]|uniref:Uncharacterized protein n=1 Tax=Owenia fusiformis TaxID=6347 RepID=A0A8J1XQU6_OWEFU|nr:unnamed protein product [Owenia fusiformis]